VSEIYRKRNAAVSCEILQEEARAYGPSMRRRRDEPVDTMEPPRRLCSGVHFPTAASHQNMSVRPGCGESR